LFYILLLMMKSNAPDNIFLDLSSHSAGDPFIVSSGLTLPYEQFFALVDSALLSLKKRCKPGQRIAILCPNCPEYLILLFAMWRVKIVPVLLNPRWPADYLAANLQNIDCLSIILSPESTFLKIKGIKKFGLEKVVNFSSRDHLSLQATRMSINLNQDASIIFTSGSAGMPKAVLHTLGNHYYNALGSNQNIRLRPGDRWLLSLPLYHVGGLGIVFRTLLAGAMIMVPDPSQNLSECVQYQKITHLSLVATQLYRLLQDDTTIPRLQKMKAILLGGGPIPYSLLKTCSRWELPVFVSYGSTEMASQITTTGRHDGVRRWKTSGKVLPYRELKIAPDREIMVRGKTLGKGYIQSGKVKKVTDKSGWFPSGDLGKLDEEGYLTVAGRKDNMFVSGGENIQPEEIEAQIRNIAGVEEAMVVPVPDPEFGQRPVAIVKIQEDKPAWPQDRRQGTRIKGQGSRHKEQGARRKRPITKSWNLNTKYKVENTKYIIQEVREYLRKVLPGIKVPDYFLFWPEEASKGLKISREEFRKWAERKLKTEHK
jgi:O-succinylbenzoic acid--CoA ligase